MQHFFSSFLPLPLPPRPRGPIFLGAAALLVASALLPTAPVLAQGGGSPRTVKVSKGDTLEGIAQRTGVSVTELRRLNGLKEADLLQVGQTLRLPTPPSRAVVVVKSGDTLESIAKANNTTAAALQQANPGIEPSRLKVGSTLRLPSGRATAPSPAPRAPAAAAATAPQIAPAATAPKLPSSAEIQPTPPLLPQPETSSRGRWRYFGDTVVDWGGWKRMPDGVRFTLVQPAARDVGEVRSQATAIAVDCSTLRHTWRVKEAWEAWSIPTPRSVGQQIVLDLCGNTAAEDRRPVPAPPTPGP